MSSIHQHSHGEFSNPIIHTRALLNFITSNIVWEQFNLWWIDQPLGVKRTEKFTVWDICRAQCVNDLLRTLRGVSGKNDTENWEIFDRLLKLHYGDQAYRDFCVRYADNLTYIDGTRPSMQSSYSNTRASTQHAGPSTSFELFENANAGFGEPFAPYTSPTEPNSAICSTQTQDLILKAGSAEHWLPSNSGSEHLLPPYATSDTRQEPFLPYLTQRQNARLESSSAHHSLPQKSGPGPAFTQYSNQNERMRPTSAPYSKTSNLESRLPDMQKVSTDNSSIDWQPIELSVEYASKAKEGTEPTKVSSANEMVDLQRYIISPEEGIEDDRRWIVPQPRLRTLNEESSIPLPNKEVVNPKPSFPVIEEIVGDQTPSVPSRPKRTVKCPARLIDEVLDHSPPERRQPKKSASRRKDRLLEQNADGSLVVEGSLKKTALKRKVDSLKEGVDDSTPVERPPKRSAPKRKVRVPGEDAFDNSEPQNFELPKAALKVDEVPKTLNAYLGKKKMWGNQEQDPQYVGISLPTPNPTEDAETNNATDKESLDSWMEDSELNAHRPLTEYMHATKPDERLDTPVVAARAFHSLSLTVPAIVPDQMHYRSPSMSGNKWEERCDYMQEVSHGPEEDLAVQEIFLQFVRDDNEQSDYFSQFEDSDEPQQPPSRRSEDFKVQHPPEEDINDDFDMIRNSISPRLAKDAEHRQTPASETPDEVDMIRTTMSPRYSEDSEHQQTPEEETNDEVDFVKVPETPCIKKESEQPWTPEEHTDDDEEGFDPALLSNFDAMDQRILDGINRTCARSRRRAVSI